jgi:hypothetical protein
MDRFEARATKLWRRIFRDGSGDDDAGFWSLKTILRERLVEKKNDPVVCDCEKTDGNAPDKRALISSPTAELAHTLDGIVGSALATTVAQRLAKHALYSGGHDIRRFDSLFHEASAPGIGWWRMLNDKWFRNSEPSLVEVPVNDTFTPAIETTRGASHHPMIVPVAAKMDSATVNHSSLYPFRKTVAARDGRDLFAQHISDFNFWKSGRSARRHISGERARKRFFEGYSQHRRIFNVSDSVDNVRPLSDPECKKQAAARKYSGILAYPTLAKYLGLISDITIPVEFLLHKSNHARTCGAIAVLVRSGDADAATMFQKAILASELIWTAYVIRRSADCANYEYFGPCEADDTDSILASIEKPSTPPANRLLSDGILNLGVTLPSNTMRFALHTLDVTNLITNLTCMAATPESAQEFPELRTRGIALADCSTKDDRDSNKVPVLPPDPVPAGSPSNVLYCRDLVTGYYIDCALAPNHGKWQRKDRWTTLTARSIGYGREIDSKFLTRQAVLKVRDRDDGYVRPLPRQDKDCTVVNSELFTWTGESLAIPHMSDAVEVCKPCENASSRLEMYPDPCNDLAVDLSYDLPTSTRTDQRYRRPCPLRETRSYMIGARLRLMNGCTVPFGQAVARYISGNESLALGGTDGKPYKYLRRDTVHAPEVLLPWNEPLVTVTRIEDANGDTIREMVIRTGVVDTPSSRRFLIPPRTTFDLAEQNGCFDLEDTSSPPGAFSSDIRVQFDSDLGVLPTARSGHWSFPAKRKKTPCGTNQTSAREENRGPVLILDSAAKASRTKFYPDPLARSLCARFEDRSPTLGQFSSMKSPVEFWPTNSLAKHASPILLELKKGTPRRSDSNRGWFDASDNTAEITPLNSSKPVSLRKLSIALAPGETIKLEIYSIPDAEKLLYGHHCAREAFKLLRNHYRSGDMANLESMGLPKRVSLHVQSLAYSLLYGTNEERLSLFAAVLKQGSIPPLMTKEVITLTHAVDKPEAPQFAWQDEVGGEVRIYPVVLSIKAGDSPETSEDTAAKLGKTKTRTAEPEPSVGNGGGPNDQVTWRRYAENQEKLDPNRRNWPSGEGGATTFFIGEIKVDRKTTGRIRCEAEWKEYGPEITRHVPKDGYVTAIPTHRAQLFSFGDIALVDDLLGDKIDLLNHDNTRSLRALAHSFVNGRARHLQLRVIATSRFAQYFPRETLQERKMRETSGVGKYERGTSDLTHSLARVWVPCTFRPFPPQIDKILPLFRWGTEVHDDGAQIRWKRESSLRIFLGQSWFSSGEEEKLGIVCWPKDLLNSDPDREAEAASRISRMRTDALDADENLRRYGRFLTRWGADPIQLSGPLDDFISADRFVGVKDEQKVSQTLHCKDPLLYLPQTEQAQSPVSSARKGAEGLPVCVLTYTPELDSRDGNWFTDVMIDPGAAYFPFVQLGLVRYQAHSVDGLELSYPSVNTIQLPPTRQGKIDFLNDHEFIFELSGVGYRQTKPDLSQTASPSESDFPFLRLKLLRAHESGFNNGRVNWQPALDTSGHPIEVYDLRVTTSGQPIKSCDLRPKQRGAELVWTKTISLPVSRCRVRFGLLMEEFEMRAHDVVDRTDNNRVVFAPKLRQRGPMFAHIADLGMPDGVRRTSGS